MTKLKIFTITLLSILLLFLLSTIVSAADITYETEFFSDINTAIYVNGLDNNLESGYNYYIYITQDNTTDADTVISAANMAKCDSLLYDSENDQFYMKNSVHNTGNFEKAGDYYAYIVKGQATNKSSFSLIDGPTKLKRPQLLANGERITAYFNKNGASYHISQYDYYTKMFGTNRKVNFFLGKIEDTSLLTKLSNEEPDAYDALYKYGKENDNYLYTGSFDTTSTGTLNYDIWKDYNELINGDYYFVYFKLDDENGTYAEMDDVQPYQVYMIDDSLVLSKFSSYNAKEDDNKKEIEPVYEPVYPVEPKKEDTTIAVTKLPNAGNSVRIFLIIVFSSIVGIIASFKFSKLKDI